MQLVWLALRMDLTRHSKINEVGLNLGPKNLNFHRKESNYKKIEKIERELRKGRMVLCLVNEFFLIART